MKKLKCKIVWIIALLVNMIPVHCMLTSGRQLAKRGMSTATAARLGTMRQQKGLAAEKINGGSQIDTSTWSGWFKSFFQRSPQAPTGASGRSQINGSSPFGQGGQRRSYSTKQPVSSNELVDISHMPPADKDLMMLGSYQPITPAISQPGWFAGQAARATYNYFLDEMNQLKNGKDISMILLLQHIQASNYNPINIPDEAGHSFYYYLLKNFKNLNKDRSYLNTIKQSIYNCKLLGAQLNEFDRMEINKDMQDDSSRLIAAINDKNLAALYDIACGFQVYDFAGLDNLGNTIDKDSINEYISQCRNDPSLFKKLVEYGNVVRRHQKNPQPYSEPKNYYQSIADKMLQDYNKYQAFLPISFDQTFDINKPLTIGVRIWQGQGTTIRSKKTMQQMVSQGELLDYIQEDFFKNPKVVEAISNYGWWVFSRTGPRVMHDKTKQEDSFYGINKESYSLAGGRTITFPQYEELKELLKQDIENKITHLQQLHEVFLNLAKSIKPSNSFMDNFDTMYKDLVSFDNVYTPNELAFRNLMLQYHEDKLKFKIESGEITEQQAKKIADKIAQLNNMRDAYQKEQLAKE